MASSARSLFIGIGGTVLAIDPTDGHEIWRRKLASHSFMTILERGEWIFAGVGGELFCLDAVSGQLLWSNHLKGLGVGLITFGSSPENAGEATAQAEADSAATIVAT